MADAQEVARISVRVIPDTTGFARNLMQDLRRIEARLPAIEVDVVVSKASKILDDARRMVREAQARAGDVEVGVTVAQREMQQLRKNVDEVFNKPARLVAEYEARTNAENLRHEREKLDDIADQERKADIHLEATNTLATAARIAYAARDRIVALNVRVSERSLAAAATAIAALSGARMVGDTFDQLWQFAKNLDKTIPLISAATSAVTLLGQVATTSVSNLLSLFVSVAQLAPLALTLPGILTGIGIGVGVTVAALKDFNEVLPEVKESLSDMQDSLSKRFWDRATDPMRSMFEVFLPRLQSGFDRTADRAGRFTGLLASAFERHANDGALEGMFDDLAKSIEVASFYTDDFADIVFGLGKIGARQLPRLAKWVGDISSGFAGWLEENDANGNIDKWVNRAITKMQALGSIVGNTSSILYNLGVAAEMGGAATLEGMAEATGKWAEAVRSPGFQSKMASFFAAFHNGLDIVQGASGPAFITWIESVRTGLMEMSRVMSPSIGRFLGNLLTTLSSAPVDQGWTNLLQGLSTGLSYFSDRLPEMGPGLGALMSIIGSLSANLLPVLADAFVWLSDVLARVGPDIETIITNFSAQFRELIDEWGPKVTPIIESIAAALAKFSEQDGSLLKAAGAVASLAVALKVITSLGSIVGVLRGIGAAMTLISGKGGAAGSATGVSALGRSLGLLVSPAGLAAGAIAATALHLNNLFNNSPEVQAAIDDTSVAMDNLRIAMANFEARAPAFAGAFKGAFGSLTIPELDWSKIWGDENQLAIGRRELIERMRASLIQGAADLLDGNVMAAFNSSLGGLFTGVIDTDALSNLSMQVLAQGIAIGQNVIKGIVQGVAWLANAPGAAIRAGVQLMIDAAKNILGIHSPSTVFIEIGQNVIQGLINGILALAGQLPGIMAGIAASLPGAFAGAGTQLTSVGSALGASLITGFKLVTGQGQTEAVGGGAITGIKAGIQGVDLTATGTTSMGGFITGIQSQFGSATTAGTTTADSARAGAAAVSLVETGQTAVRGFVDAILAAVGAARDAGTAITSILQATLNLADLGSIGARLIAAFVSAIANAVGSAASAGAAVASAAANAMSGYAGSAYNSGAAIGGSFASGIASKVSAASAAASALAGAARANLPNSPAKEGPFSGSGWGGWGESIGDELAHGLRAKADAVRSAAVLMAGTAVPSSGAIGGNLADNLSNAQALAPTGAEGFGAVTINARDGATAEEIFNTFDSRLTHQRRKGKYAHG